MSRHDHDALPYPAALAARLLQWAWREDGPAVIGDLAEALRRSRRSGWRRWSWGWSQVVRGAVHGVWSELTRRRTRLRPGLALRLAFRGLVRDPGTSIAASGILALGLASAATFFAILHGLDRPLPVPEGDRIVRLDVVQPSRDGRSVAVTGADLGRWRETPALAGIGGSRSFPATLRDPERWVSRALVAAITPGALDLLEVSPVAGRLPSGADAEGAILLRSDLVEALFGDGDDVLGRTLDVDGRPGVVSAILPETFGFPTRHSAWVVEAPARHPAAVYEPVARLADGASEAGATAQLQPRWSAYDTYRSRDDAAGVVRVRGYTEGRGESGELVLFAGLVLIGVALLLIACANAASLLMVRATERIHLLGVQAALGASRAQLASQLLFESLGLALVGGVAGLGVAALMADYVQRTMGPENFGYYWTRVAVDGPVIGFTASLVVGAALLAGIAPVVRVLRRDLHGVLKSGRGSDGNRRGLVGRLFVGAQLALSCAALAAAGLTAKSMSAARDFGRALDGDGVLLGTVALAADEAEGRRIQRADVIAAAGAVSGARMATVALGAPGFGETFSPLEVDGAEAGPDAPRLGVAVNVVEPTWFELFDLALLSGRTFSEADGADGEPVAIVNAAFVTRHWPAGSPLGRRVRVAGVSDVWARVVGVVEGARLGDGPQLRNDRVYRPLAQVDLETVMVLAAAADGDGQALAGSLRAALAEAAPDLPLADVRTLASAHAFMTRAQGTFSMLAMSGGAAGLFVAVVGLYALLAFRVRQRRRELGVRKALGADRGTLIRGLLLQALRQIVPATAVGLGVAWVAAPLLSAILLGGDPRSPAVFAGTALVFVGSGLAAALLPALRAGRVEPATVLRSE